MRTARFSKIVEAAGRPVVWNAWSNPEKDPQFMRAAREHRVMSVGQEAAGKTDSGSVGVLHGPHTQLLVFPRSLEKFKDRRVVGINYDLIEQPQRADLSEMRATRAPKRTTGKQRSVPPIEGPARAQTPAKADLPQPQDPDGHAEARAAHELAAARTAMRRAAKQLEGGNSVAAYRTLESALGASTE